MSDKEPIEVVIEHAIDQKVRFWHIGTEISDTSEGESFFRSNAIDPLRYTNVGPLAKSIVEGLLQIPGVKKVSIDTYMIVVVKAEFIFSWDTIEPAIDELLRSRLKRSLRFYRATIDEETKKVKEPELMAPAQSLAALIETSPDREAKSSAWTELRPGSLLPEEVDLDELAVEAKDLDIRSRIALIRSYTAGQTHEA